MLFSFQIEDEERDLPAELSHIAETVEIFEVDVRDIAGAELLTERRHPSPGAAGSVVTAIRGQLIINH